MFRKFVRGLNLQSRQPSSFLSREIFAIFAGVFLLVACDQGSETAVEPASEVALAKPPKLTPDQLAAAAEEPGFFFLDVRSPQEIAELGTLLGYVNIPIEELEGRLAEIPLGRAVVTA